MDAVNGKKWGPHNKPSGQDRRTKKRTQPLTDREKNLARNLVGGMVKKAALLNAGYSPSVAADPDNIMTRPRFVRYLDELRKQQVERFDYTIENLCARLENIAFAAMEKNQYGAAVQAVMGIGKMMGHLADRTEIELHVLSKPSREPTDVLTLSPEEWQRQFTPVKQLQ